MNSGKSIQIYRRLKQTACRDSIQSDLCECDRNQMFAVRLEIRDLVCFVFVCMPPFGSRQKVTDEGSPGSHDCSRDQWANWAHTQLRRCKTKPRSDRYVPSSESI